VIVEDYGYYYKKNEVFVIVLFDMVYVFAGKICSLTWYYFTTCDSSLDCSCSISLSTNINVALKR